MSTAVSRRQGDLQRGLFVEAIAALGIVYFLVQEGREAWNGDSCCEDDFCDD